MDMRYQVILGDVYLQNGKKQEAYDVYQKVLAAEPDNPMAIFSMASYYKQTGQEELLSLIHILKVAGMNTLPLASALTSILPKKRIIYLIIIRERKSRKFPTTPHNFP